MTRFNQALGNKFSIGKDNQSGKQTPQPQVRGDEKVVHRAETEEIEQISETRDVPSSMIDLFQ